MGGESDLAAPLTFALTHTDAAQPKRSALGARDLARATPRSYSNLGGAPDTSGRASEQAGDSREGDSTSPGSRSRGGTRDSSERREEASQREEEKEEPEVALSSSQQRKRKEERLSATRKRVCIREARMVRRFCNGAVALGIALTACAAFPRAVMAIDLSRFYGHFNTKRSGKSTTGSLV